MGDWLIDRFSEFRDDICIIWNGCEYRYSDLLKGINRWTDEFKSLGIKNGDCIAFKGDHSPNIVMLLLALIMHQNIIVPLNSDIGKKVYQCAEIAKIKGVFDFNDDDDWSYNSYETVGSHRLIEQLRTQAEAGLVLFTSGTTGESKASLLQVSRMLEKYRTKRKHFRTLAFFKLDHISGINTLFSILCSGGMLISIKERAPQAICQAIEHFNVQLLPTTPTFLNMLALYGAYKNYNLTSLELITYGAEPMPLSTLKSINRILPKVRLKQTYGLTELGILSSKSMDSSSNWIKLGGEGFEVKVIDNILWIRSHSAMLGYLNAPSLFDESGWLNTGDEVEVDGEYFRILGRKQNIINVGGEKVYPSEVEDVLLQMPNILDVTVEGRPNPITGQIVSAKVVLLKPEAPDNLRNRIFEFCKNRIERYKIPIHVEISENELFGSQFKKIR